MTEFKKELNKLLKERAISDIVNTHEQGMLTFRDTIRAISERMDLEADVYWAAWNGDITIEHRTDDDLKEKIKGYDTTKLLALYGGDEK